MITRIPAVPLLLAAVLAACATPQSRIKKHQSDFDSYPPAVQQKIRDGQADVGFTKEQAAMALGKPDRMFTRKTANGDQEIWAYGGAGGGTRVGFGFGMFSGGPVSIGTGVDMGPGPRAEDRLRLVFQDGVVFSVEKSL